MRKALVAFSLLLAVFVLLLMTDEVINKRVFSEETSPIPLFSCTAIVPLTGQQGEAVQFQGSVAEYGQVTIDPGGGEYSFSNGVTLEVPADAVSESTTVGIRLLEKEEVEPVLQSYGFTEKYFMAGFEAVPAGLSFNQPIKVTLPSELLRGTTDVPLPFIVDAENQIYCYDTPGSSSSAVMDINKKLKGMQSEREILEYYYDPETGNKIKITVEKFPDRQKVIEAVAEIIDVVPEDCKATPPPCSCIVVRLYERMKDLIVEGECSFIDLEGSSEFTQCPGKPKVEFKFIEDQRGKIRITPSSAELKIGDTETFTWELIDANGIPIPAHSITAYIKDENVANTFEWQEGFGKVRAINCGKTKLIVEAGCENRGEASIKVISEAASIEIDPPAKTNLEVGETLQLTAKVFDECENELENQPVKWSWSSPDTGLVDLDPDTGYLEAKAKGIVEITATVFNLEDKITLSISQAVYHLTWKVTCNGYYEFEEEQEYSSVLWSETIDAVWEGEAEIKEIYNEASSSWEYQVISVTSTGSYNYAYYVEYFSTVCGMEDPYQTEYWESLVGLNSSFTGHDDELKKRLEQSFNEYESSTAWPYIVDPFRRGYSCHASNFDVIYEETHEVEGIECSGPINIFARDTFVAPWVGGWKDPIFRNNEDDLKAEDMTGQKFLKNVTLNYVVLDLVEPEDSEDLPITEHWDIMVIKIL